MPVVRDDAYATSVAPAIRDQIKSHPHVCYASPFHVCLLHFRLPCISRPALASKNQAGTPILWLSATVGRHILPQLSLPRVFSPVLVAELLLATLRLYSICHTAQYSFTIPHSDLPPMMTQILSLNSRLRAADERQNFGTNLRRMRIKNLTQQNRSLAPACLPVQVLLWSDLHSCLLTWQAQIPS